jgi:hypothetical protein
MTIIKKSFQAGLMKEYVLLNFLCRSMGKNSVDIVNEVTAFDPDYEP